MEIDITQFVNDECPVDFSASVAEIGNDAGRQTWSAAMETAPDYLAQFITNTDARDELTRWIRGFGAWNDAEIAAWSDTELCALLIQFIAGDLREGEIG